MTKEDLRRLATEGPPPPEPLERTTGKDTYRVVEVFRDTSFLTERTQKGDKKSTK